MPLAVSTNGPIFTLLPARDAFSSGLALFYCSFAGRLISFSSFPARIFRELSLLRPLQKQGCPAVWRPRLFLCILPLRLHKDRDNHGDGEV